MNADTVSEKNSSPFVKILIVDDQEPMRTVLRKNLEENGYQVADAENGKAAQQILASDNQINLVISDIRMPEMDGLQLTTHIKKTKPIPIILMTGFTELTETHDAYALGADAFIPKPFKSADMIEAIRVCLLQDQDPAKNATDETDYCKISIDDFISGSNIQYDIFIRLSDKRIIKIAHCGEDLSLDRIRNYKSKSINSLLLRKDDFKKYVGFNLSITKAITKNEKLETSKKLNLLKHTGEVISEHLFFQGVDQDSFDHSKIFVESSLSVMTENTNVLDLLTIMRSHSDFVYIHSIAVSLYSVMIARKLEWISGAILFKLALGGFMHDIGKKEIDREILEKPTKTMSENELKLFEKHTTRGMDILSSLEGIPNDVLFIVQQHHENCMGSGYPAGLRTSKVFPLARLVAVVNVFCNLVLKNPDSPGYSPVDALNQMTTVHPDAYDPAFLDALRRLFRI